MAASDDADEIRTLARTFEYDRYLTALLMPRDVREPLLVIAAFSGELRRIPALVTEPMMGAMRLQWWRDALDAAADGRFSATGNPLADALIETVHKNALPWGLVHGMIDAADAEFDPEPFREIAETRQHLIKSEAAQFELAARITAAGAGPEIWRSAGLAYGSYRRALEFTARQRHARQTFLAREAHAGADAHDNSAGAIADGAAWFNGEARAALAEVTARRPGLDPASRRVLLPLAIIGPFLDRSTRQAAAGHAAAGEASPLARAWRLLWTHWQGGF